MLCIALAFLMPGCSSNKNSQSSAGSGGTLYWWRSKSDASEATLKQIAQEYTSQNPGIKIEVVSVDPRNYENEILSALASYQTVTNAPDIFSINVEDLPRFAPQLVPAADDLFSSTQNTNQKTSKMSTEYVSDAYESVVTKSCILKDSAGNSKVYGLPMGLDTLALYINSDAIQKSVQSLRDKNRADNALSQEQLTAITKAMQAPPKTWTELTKIVPYLTIRDGNTITQSAIAMGTSANVERSADLLQTMMLQNGTQMTSADENSAAFNLSTAEAGSSQSSSIPGLRALEFYLQFSSPSSALYTWNEKMPNSVTAFEQGQVAMIAHYSDLYRFLISEMPTLKSSIDVQPLPQVTDPSSPLASEKVKSMAKMNVEVASSAKGDAKRQLAAWKFIQYVTSKQGSATYLSAMKLTSPLKDNNGQPKFQAFATQKTWADLWYKGIKSQDVDQNFISMIENAAAKKKSNKDALDQAAKDTSAILAGSNVKWPNANIQTNAQATSQ